MNLCVISLYLFCINTLKVQGVKKLRIIHTNDIHSRIEAVSKDLGKCIPQQPCYGGYPRLKAAMDAQKQKADSEGIPWICLDAGDQFQGSLYYTLFKWPVIAEFGNLMGYDCTVLGNHEFDDGPIPLGEYLNNLTYPMLVSNIDVSAEPALNEKQYKKSLIIERGGLRMAIIGFLTPETKISAKPGKVKFIEEATAIRAEINKLKSQNVSLFIALGHSGYEVDKVLAEKVEELDIVVGGHSHTFLYSGKKKPDSDPIEGPYPTKIKQANNRIVPVVQAFAGTKYLGVFDVELTDSMEVINALGTPILLTDKLPRDPKLAAIADKYKKDLHAITSEVIGKTKITLDGNCRFGECNLGSLIADAYVDYAIRTTAKRNWTLVAAGIYTSGAVRSTIRAGDITREDVLVTVPFQNPVKVLSIQGKYILAAFEWSAYRYDVEKCFDGRAEFLQVSGFKIVYDLDQDPGYRVVKAQIRCANCRVPEYADIDPEAKYNMVVSGFIAGGGDNFTMLKEHGKEIQTLDQVDTEIVTQYIQRLQVIYQGIEGRIIVNRKRPCSTANAVNNNLILALILAFAPLILLK